MTTTTLTNTKTEPEIEALTFPSLPPFPDNIPTTPLIRLSLANLRTDSSESDALFTASKNLGFFYPDLRHDPLGQTLLSLSEELFEFAPKLFDLGRDELLKYDYKNKGSHMGYKGFGAGIVDENGTRDRIEFYNIPKDDILEISKVPLAHPQPIYDHHPLLKQYMRASHTLLTFLLEHLNRHLKLPPSTLSNLHTQTTIPGDHIRLIKSPPQPPSNLRTAQGKHTDFGSLTLLFNRLGGLQILPPPSLRTKEWMYVRPLSGHCIINLGDAMTKFTRGLLRSNVHRVVSPPGEQGKETRWSVVYFLRPRNEVLMRALEGGVLDGLGDGEGEEEDKEMSAKEWIFWKAMRYRNIKADASEEERRRLWKEGTRGS